MNQFEQLPSNSNEVCSSSAFASSPSPSLPVTQSQAQTPIKLSGLSPLPRSETRKSSREKSKVSDHFEKYDDVVESVKKDESKYLKCKKRARYKYCFITYAADPNLNKTSSLRKHIESLCKKYSGRVGNDKRQKTLSFDQALDGLSTIGYIKEDWLRSCVEVVVMDELPFNVVEGKWFRRFCESLNPHFQVSSRRTLVRNFMVMYDEMKQKLKGELA